MSELMETLLRERVRAAADDAAAASAPALDARILVTRGLRQRWMHRASLGAALTVVVALIAVVGLRGAPAADEYPSFVTDPPASAGPPPSADPGATSSPGPGEPREGPGRQPEIGPAGTGPLTSHVPGCVPARAVQAPDGIEVELRLDATIYARDAHVAMELTVTNRSGRAVAYQQGGQRFDLWVQRDDEVVWTWAFGQRFQQFLAERSLAPRGVETGKGAWDQSRCSAGANGVALPGAEGTGGPPPGHYVARALWRTADGGWWSDPVEFVVL